MVSHCLVYILLLLEALEENEVSFQSNLKYSFENQSFLTGDPLQANGIYIAKLHP